MSPKPFHTLWVCMVHACTQLKFSPAFPVGREPARLHQSSVCLVLYVSSQGHAIRSDPRACLSPTAEMYITSGFPAHLILSVTSHRWPFLMPGEQGGRCFLHECCSVAQLCLTLHDPVDCNTPGFPVFLCLPEPAQTHVHRVGVTSFSSGPPSFPASASFPRSWLMNKAKHMLTNRTTELLESLIKKKSWEGSARSGFLPYIPLQCSKVFQSFSIFIVSKSMLKG